MTQQVTISHCIICGKELKDPIPDFGTGYFQLNDGNKICEYCYMGAYVGGYTYDRDGNRIRDPNDMGIFEKLYHQLRRILKVGDSKEAVE